VFVALVVALWTTAAGGAAAATPHPTGTATGAPTHAVPPPAPAPTDSGRSPAAPDPNPPRGGLGPNGEAVGGSALLRRDVITPHGAPALPGGLTAQGWVLFDVDTGAILAARDPHGRYQPASILKTLTSVTLLPQLPGSRIVHTTTAEAITEGSHAGVVAGGSYTVDELFSGLLLVSGNDAAMALADAAGGVAHTVTLMNQTALSLGAYDTLVQTPSGLDGWQQLTSAYDMAIFLRSALAMPRFVAYERQSSAVLPLQSVDGFGPVTMLNQNEEFLTTVPGAVVAKTGYTDAAQHTFVGAIDRNGRRLGVAFLRAQRYPTDQWQQATALMNWGFALPAGIAPVGELAPPVTLKQPTATALTLSVSAVAAIRERVAAASASALHSHDPLRLWLVALGLVLLLGGGVAHWHASRLH
jgi:D-alanyl-D-alanine carboxypeptidase (penicillin-binding protein 5/6)